MNTADIFSTEQKRESGKAYFFNHDADNEKKNYGLKLIIDAHSQKDLEATYIVARLILDGVLKSSSSDQQGYALTLMCSSANCFFTVKRFLILKNSSSQYMMVSLLGKAITRFLADKN